MLNVSSSAPYFVTFHWQIFTPKACEMFSVAIKVSKEAVTKTNSGINFYFIAEKCCWGFFQT